MDLLTKFLYRFAWLFALGIIFDLVIFTEYPMSMIANLIISGGLALMELGFDIYKLKKTETQNR